MPAEARVPAEVCLGGVLVAPATVLAPMAGGTDTVFRRFIRHASLCGGACGALSKGLTSDNHRKEQPSEAKASVDCADFAGRLKSCPDTDVDSSSSDSSAGGVEAAGEKADRKRTPLNS